MMKKYLQSSYLLAACLFLPVKIPARNGSM